MKAVLVLLGIGGMVALAAPAVAAGGPLGIDHRLPYDSAGIWGKAHQNQVLGATLLFTAGAALWEGDGTRFGHTLWQAGDAVLFTGVSALVLKNLFQRTRPEDSANPNLWFQGFGNTSFPSGHVALTAAAITPLVLEYGRERPWVYALEAIPLYEAVGRVKVRAHWQSDVLAAWGLGTLLGWYAHSRKVPVLIMVLPRGFAVGLHASF